MRYSNAVESGPPETASTRAGSAVRSANNASASASPTASLTAGTLLFPLDRLLDGRLGARIFAAHVAEGHAREFSLVHGSKRLAEPQQRFGRFGAGFIFFRQCHKGIGGFLIVLALEQAFAEAKLGFRRHPVGRIFCQKPAKCLLGKRIVPALQIPHAEIESVTRRRRRRRCRNRIGAGRAWVSLPRTHRKSAGTRVHTCSCSRSRTIGRRLYASSSLRRDHRRRLRGNRTQHSRCSGSVGVFGWIECVRTPTTWRAWLIRRRPHPTLPRKRGRV